MHLRAPAILLSARPHGETGAIIRALTAEAGLVAGYVAGGRGRQLRPAMIPGNRVALDLAARFPGQLPFAKIELERSRAALMTEPVPAAAIGWVCALTAAAMPERAPFPPLYEALDALLEAIGLAPSARGWLAGLYAYEVLLLSEMGYGPARLPARPRPSGDTASLIAALGGLRTPIANSLLDDARRDVMAARDQLMERLARMV
ncbi:MAG: DNA repair protein RecO [Erythrobacter sp.]